VVNKIKYQIIKNKKGGIVLAMQHEKRIAVASKIIIKFAEAWDRVVWIAPSGYLDTDEYELLIRKYLKGYFNKVGLYSYDDLSQRSDIYLELLNAAKTQRVFGVVDENLFVKNTYSWRTKRVSFLRDFFTFRLLLARNLTSRGLRDIYAQLNFVSPAILKMTETQFVHQFMPYYEDEFQISKRWSNRFFDRKVLNLIRPFLVFCSAWDLSNFDYREIWFELTPQEKEAYRNDKEMFLRKKDRVCYLQVVQQFQYCYTICVKKVDYLRFLLQQIRDKNEKVILYTKYLGEVKFLKESGVLKGSKYVVMCGTTDKQRAIGLFATECNVMICTYKVDIPRLVLKNCQNLIYFSQTFDYKDKLFAMYRLCGNRKHKVRIFDFWVNTKLELMIKDNLLRKRKLLQEFSQIISENGECCL